MGRAAAGWSSITSSTGGVARAMYGLPFATRIIACEAFGLSAAPMRVSLQGPWHYRSARCNAGSGVCLCGT
jgi:hypothetical protein